MNAPRLSTAPWKGLGECSGEICPSFQSWHSKLFDEVGEHTARDAGNLKADQCAQVTGCIFEQTIQIEEPQNA
jgi:hypothetical protein